MNTRTRWTLLAVLACLLLNINGLPAGRKKGSRQAAEPKILRYGYRPGDILAYGQVFETENHPAEAKEAVYHVRCEWSVKLAVVGQDGRTFGIAAQYNLVKLEIEGREALERAVGKAAAREILSPYENVTPALARYLVIDDLGEVKNDSYDFNMLPSNVYSFVSRIAVLPGLPLPAGSTYKVGEEESILVQYVGERLESRGSFDVFEANHPSGKAVLAVDRSEGIPDRMEYTTTYLAAGQVRREGYSLVFRNKRTADWAEMQADPDVNKALVLAALSRRDIACEAKVIRDLLGSADPERQNLAAAYCGLRGIPPGLDMVPLLSAANPIVRFNAAKALFKFRGEGGPLRDMAIGADAYLRRRSQNFYDYSTYMVPAPIQKLYASVQRWLFADGPRPEIPDDALGDLREVLRFVKPANSRASGCYKKFLAEDSELKHPYYLRLPEDYDPAEVYPLLVYLGMGDGRGDIALKSVADALKKAGRDSEYVVLVPQAHGKWWEPEAEAAVNAALKTVLQTVSVNTNRIFLAGSSNGGMGTMYYGTHLPEKFAALASNMGFPAVKRDFPGKPAELEPLKNLFNAGVFLSHGKDDDWVTPEGDREAASFLKRNRIPVTFVEIARKGHDVPIGDVLARALEVFEKQRRNPSPPRIDFVMNDPAYPTCYWITILGTTALPARVAAHITGNKVEIETSGVRDLRVSLDETLVDLSRPVSIRINDRDAFQGLLHASSSSILSSAKERTDAQTAYSVSLALTTGPFQ